MEELAIRSENRSITSEAASSLNTKKILGLKREANENAEKMLVETVKFSIIAAEAVWMQQMERYTEIDNQIKEIELKMKLKRDGDTRISRKKLESKLKKLKLGSSDISKYIIRYDLYESLKNISEQYEPFKDRIAGANFTLPKYPKFPKRGRWFMIGGGQPGISGGNTFGIGSGIGIQ